ncbi:hypothetical protein [Beijerinckia mobilis]|uniref:hypothetical protein n=1 Tax=Beijerinckia mobilis TaxID=231434 RepID=UPI000554584E|nr:hypothetical protein [Beijerinckia mobilis]
MNAGDKSERDEADEENTPLEWDDGLAAELIGKYVIAGFVHLERDGISVREKVQVHGVILDANREEGFQLALRGEGEGQTMLLPANTNAFVKAKPGRYRLKGSNERVINPDYIGLWTIKTPVLH